MRAFALLLIAAACGDDGVRHTPDACADGTPTVEVTTPASFACHDPYTAKVTLTNNTCSPLEVRSVMLTAVVTTGQCSPPAPGTYPGSTVAVGKTGTVLDLTAGAFCCTSPGCPASFQCDETYTFQIVTATHGTLTATKDVHLSLDSCDVICP